MSNSVVVEVLGYMVGPVSKYVFDGFTVIREEGCPVWYEVFERGDNLYEGGEENGWG